MRTYYEGHDRAYQKRKEQGQAGWDTTAEGYETFQRMVEDIFHSVAIPTQGKLLELGCGAGNMTLWLAKKGYQVYGVDIAPTAITWAQEKAQQHHVHADFKVGNVLDLHEYADNLFDIVFDGHCFHCIIGTDRHKFLDSAFRVLKHGGYLIINTMCGEVTNEEMRIHFDAQSRCLLYGDIASRYIGLPEDILEEIKANHFSIVYQRIENRRDDKDSEVLRVVAMKPNLT